ncbi:MAG: hypothetical protein U0R51_06625 [Solirubrobacterales bacterium]
MARAEARRRLHRVHRGVYAVGVLRADPDARWAAAVLEVGAALRERARGLNT